MAYHAGYGAHGAWGAGRAGRGPTGQREVSGAARLLRERGGRDRCPGRQV